MSTFVLASECYCQSCRKLFHLNNQRISTVINMDIDGFEKTRFMNGTLNKIRCDKCNAEFTHETAMVVFSYKHKFAIYVNPHCEFDRCSGLKAPNGLFPAGFAFREVNYLVEAREKTNIFLSGLSEFAVEKFKYENFSNEDATPFDEYNLVFASHTDNEYIFEKYDYNDNLITRYAFSDDIKLNKAHCKMSASDLWMKINRLTINKLCKGD